MRRGWEEAANKNDDTVDIKFTLSHSDINHQRMKKGAIINHCRGEGSLTCKTLLIETLTECQEFWASWLFDKETGQSSISIRDFDQGGIDAFFPKQFVISNLQDQGNFYQEMLMIQVESGLK